MNKRNLEQDLYPQIQTGFMIYVYFKIDVRLINMSEIGIAF